MRELVLAMCVGMAGTASAGEPVALPDGKPGIGFDDLRFSPSLGRVLAPAARSGRLDLIDPATLAVEAVGGFSAAPRFDGGHDFGATSVDEGAGLLLVTDRTTGTLELIDLKTRARAGAAKLAAGPDYVRFVAPSEVWVTEPDGEQIEIFTLAGTPLVAKRAATIAVKGGPESLVIDGPRKRAYAHLWKGKTVAIDLVARAVVETWDNGCAGSRGLALDGAAGRLFVGCAEGTVTVLDVAHHGKRLASLALGGAKPAVSGVDIIDYAPALSHLYVPGGKTATMAIVAVGADAALTALEVVPTAPHAHCVTTDGAGRAFVCDPEHGQLLLVRDRHPAARAR